MASTTSCARSIRIRPNPVTARGTKRRRALRPPGHRSEDPMAAGTSNKNQPPRAPDAQQPWRARLLFLVPLALLATLYWRTSSEDTSLPPEVAYSQLYRYVDEGKVASIVFDGDAASASLKVAEAVGGHQTTTLKANLAANDPTLLPLLQRKGVQVTVKSQKQSFAVQTLLTLLPWALIIGFWVWSSRRARGMFGGGPMAGLTKNRSRQ